MKKLIIIAVIAFVAGGVLTYFLYPQLPKFSLGQSRAYDEGVKACRANCWAVYDACVDGRPYPDVELSCSNDLGACNERCGVPVKLGD